jgi:hypothetical protein
MQTIAKQIAEGTGADPGSIEDAVHRFPAGQGIRSTEKRKSKHRQKENQSRSQLSKGEKSWQKLRISKLSSRQFPFR